MQSLHGFRHGNRKAKLLEKLLTEPFDFSIGNECRRHGRRPHKKRRLGAAMAKRSIKRRCSSGNTFTGDANLDGAVNTADFTRLAGRFNTATQLWSDGDFNYDGTVNALDFNMLATNFGLFLTADPILGTVVPEPMTLALLPMLLLSRRRCRR
jgi:hypothetical protein